MKINKILLTIITVVMMIATPASATEDNDVVQIVYPLDFPDVKRVHFMLNTLNNLVKHYQKNFIEYEINVVAYGPGLQYTMQGFENTGFVGKPYLTKGGPTGKGTHGRFAALKALAADNLNVYVCENTMAKKNIKNEQLLPYAKVTPGGVLKLIELQYKGAALVKIK